MSSIMLTGKDLTVKQIHEIACNNVIVEIDKKALNIIEDARKLVYDLVDADVPVYGFNVGVGWNKDKTVFKDFFQKYNTNLILSHSLGVKPYLSCEQAKAVLVSRLNNFLVGCTGVQPSIVTFYQEMINKSVIPLIPLRGSVGNADITNLPHIGLTMLGIGKCFLNGEIVEASYALKKVNLKPIELGPKDGLAIVSSNAFSAGMLALSLGEAGKLLKVSTQLCAMTIDLTKESFNSTLESPFIDNNNIIKELKELLNRKDDQENSNYTTKTIQTLGSGKQHLQRLNNLLTIQLNSSDDNPCLLLDKRKIISCANYEPINWALPIETLILALSRVANILVKNIETLDKKSAASARTLNTKIKHVTNVSNNDFFSLAGDIEDHGNNTPHLVTRLNETINCIFDLAILNAKALDKKINSESAEHLQVILNNIKKETLLYEEGCKDGNI